MIYHEDGSVYYLSDKCSCKTHTFKTVAAHNSIVIAKKALLALTEEERVEVFCEFCTYCGVNDGGCQCWNDE